MKLLGVLKKSWPVLLLELLLLKLYLNVLGSVVDLALLGVDLSVEVELNVIFSLQSTRGTSEGQLGGLKVKLKILLGDIGDGDGQVDEVLSSIGSGRALGPENCE